MITPDKYILPQFFNKRIEEINEDLQALGWIEFVHPLAHVGEDDQGTFPEVYVNDGTKKSIRIFPHGNSLSFFTLSSAEQIDESEMYAVNLSLVVWADMTRVYPAKTYDYTTELLKDVKEVIDKHNGYSKTFDFDEVFEDFTQLERIENQNTMLPYTAFRINFIVDLLMC